jgi:hypothetical protein
LLQEKSISNTLLVLIDFFLKTHLTKNIHEVPLKNFHRCKIVYLFTLPPPHGDRGWSKIQGVPKKQEFGRFFIFFEPQFLKNDPIRANFMRGIDCAHFQRFLDPESGN